MSLESLYHATNKRLNEVHDLMASLSNNAIISEKDKIAQIQREIAARIDHILR